MVNNSRARVSGRRGAWTGRRRWEECQKTLQASVDPVIGAVDPVIFEKRVQGPAPPAFFKYHRIYRAYYGIDACHTLPARHSQYVGRDINQSLPNR